MFKLQLHVYVSSIINMQIELHLWCGARFVTLGNFEPTTVSPDQPPAPPQEYPGDVYTKPNTKLSNL